MGQSIGRLFAIGLPRYEKSPAKRALQGDSWKWMSQVALLALEGMGARKEAGRSERGTR